VETVANISLFIYTQLMNACKVSYIEKSIYTDLLAIIKVSIKVGHLLVLRNNQLV